MSQIARRESGTVWMVGTRRDLSATIREGSVQAVGRFQPVPGGEFQVPVVYVSRRATAWYRRKGTAILTLMLGIVLVLGSLATAGWMLAGPEAPGLGILILVVIGIGLWARAGRSSVTVTTTTTVKVRK